MTRVDHFMYAVADLSDGVAWAEDVFGVSPVLGGAHRGLGTCNALLSFGDTYLEIIAPDRSQMLAGSFGKRLTTLAEPGLVTWAAQGDLDSVSNALAAHGVKALGPSRTERETEQGELLVWDLLFTRGHSFGTRLPFFIDWLDCEHPSRTSPVASDQFDFELRDPNAAALGSLLAELGLDVAIGHGEPELSLIVETPRSKVVLTSTPETVALSMI